MKIGARKKSKSQSRTKHFWVALLLYSEILNSDWLELVMWLATTNHCAFQHTLIASLWNSCLKLAPSFKASYKVPVNLTRDSNIGQHQHQQKLKPSITKPICKTALVDSLRMSPEKSKVKNKKKQPGRNNFRRHNNVLRIYLLLFYASTGALGSEPTILCSRDNPQKLFSRRPP